MKANNPQRIYLLKRLENPETPDWEKEQIRDTLKKYKYKLGANGNIPFRFCGLFNSADDSDYLKFYETALLSDLKIGIRFEIKHAELLSYLNGIYFRLTGVIYF